MRIIDPGHQYALQHLDGNQEELLTFVKREGVGYPGNVGYHPGTNLQEVIRACMDRVVYLNGQIPDVCNLDAIESLRDTLWSLETRAAKRHGRVLPPELYGQIESAPTCRLCGHVGCESRCKQ